VRTLFWVETNAWNVFRHCSRTLVKLFVKLGTALLIGPAENCPISSPMQLLIQKLLWASGEGFKIASHVSPQTWYPHSIKIWRVIRWSLFLLKHLLTVFVEELLRDTCNTRGAPCILLNLPIRTYLLYYHDSETDWPACASKTTSSRPSIQPASAIISHTQPSALINSVAGTTASACRAQPLKPAAVQRAALVRHETLSLLNYFIQSRIWRQPRHAVTVERCNVWSSCLSISKKRICIGLLTMNVLE